jgi:hypothetical protein
VGNRQHSTLLEFAPDRLLDQVVRPESGQVNIHHTIFQSTNLIFSTDLLWINVRRGLVHDEYLVLSQYGSS